jgi:hypothetical protein
MINGMMVLTAIILQRTSHDSMGKEKTRQPQRTGCFPSCNPSVKKIQSCFQIIDVINQGFQSGVGFGFPHFRNLAVEHTVEHQFQFIAHDLHPGGGPLHTEQ